MMNTDSESSSEDTKETQGLPSLDERLGLALRMLRQKAKLSQRDLAQRAEVSQALICMAETGRRGRGMRLETLERIANALEQPLSKLIGLVENPPTDQRLHDLGEKFLADARK